MALIERLTHFATPRIPVHTFMAACGELSRGQLTIEQITAALGMDPATEAEWLTFALRFTTGTPVARLAAAIETHDVLLLAEYRAGPYDTAAKVRTRLGLG